MEALELGLMIIMSFSCIAFFSIGIMILCNYFPFQHKENTQFFAWLITQKYFSIPFLLINLVLMSVLVYTTSYYISGSVSEDILFFVKFPTLLFSVFFPRHMYRLTVDGSPIILAVILLCIYLQTPVFLASFAYETILSLWTVLWVLMIVGTERYKKLHPAEANAS